MEEQQVSVDGQSWPLPRPHMVIATQNPLSQRGTFPLVESQLDRFAMATEIGYPDAATEAQLALHHGGKFALRSGAGLHPAKLVGGSTGDGIGTVKPAVAEYAVSLCRATRSAPGVRLGASPRAAIWLIRSAQAHAVLARRDFVTPADVKSVAAGCLAHRLVTNEGEESATRARHIIESLLEATPAPRP